MGRHPVTNEQYGRFLDATPDHARPGYWQEGGFNQPRQPVVGVDWHDAMAFCRWMGARLPREAEWEYAARAGTPTRFWSGDGEVDLARVGWYAGNSGSAVHPVAEKPANPWGLHDVHGNVWEWCDDEFEPYTPAAVSTNPALATNNWGAAGHIIRGGCWWYHPGGCRSAWRGRHLPGSPMYNPGFRVVVPLAPSRH